MKKASLSVSSAISSIEISDIKKIEFLARSTKGVISLAQGIPSFNTPDFIKEAAKKAIDLNLANRYTYHSGIPQLRSAIALKLKEKNNINAETDQIIVTHGAIEGLMSVFMTILNPNDSVIALSPAYASHITQIQIVLQGREPIFVRLKETETGWEFDSKLLEKAITPSTKAVLICNPSNPTGKIYSKKELKEIARIALKHNLYIISDEMYEDFIYDRQKHVSIGSFKEVKDHVISIFGFSKSHAMTGWRIGYLIASKDLAAQIAKVHDCIVICPTVVSQYAAMRALKREKNGFDKYLTEYKKRRDIVISYLKKTKKLEYIKPNGSYYIFPKFKIPVDDKKLAFDMLEKAKVAVVPGSTFGSGGENHIRICFATSDELLEEGMKRFINYIEKYV